MQKGFWFNFFFQSKLEHVELSMSYKSISCCSGLIVMISLALKVNHEEFMMSRCFLAIEFPMINLVI